MVSYHGVPILSYKAARLQSTEWIVVSASHQPCQLTTDQSVILAVLVDQVVRPDT